jgi:hypothetical protein
MEVNMVWAGVIDRRHLIVRATGGTTWTTPWAVLKKVDGVSAGDAARRTPGMMI